MGTKANPGAYDCYAKAHPDEPIFTLRAKDPLAPMIVELWARTAAYTGVDTDKVAEAHRCAAAMRGWQSLNGIS